MNKLRCFRRHEDLFLPKRAAFENPPKEEAKEQITKESAMEAVKGESDKKVALVQEQLKKIGGEFNEKLSDELNVYYTSALDRAAEDGKIDVKKFEEQKKALLAKTDQILEQYAPTEAQVEAHKQEGRAAAGAAEAAESLPSVDLEKIPGALGEGTELTTVPDHLKNYEALSQDFNKEAETTLNGVNRFIEKLNDYEKEKKDSPILSGLSSLWHAVTFQDDGDLAKLMDAQKSLVEKLNLNKEKLGGEKNDIETFGKSIAKVLAAKRTELQHERDEKIKNMESKKGDQEKEIGANEEKYKGYKKQEELLSKKKTDLEEDQKKFQTLKKADTSPGNMKRRLEAKQASMADVWEAEEAKQKALEEMLKEEDLPPDVKKGVEDALKAVQDRKQEADKGKEILAQKTGTAAQGEAALDQAGQDIDKKLSTVAGALSNYVQPTLQSLDAAIQQMQAMEAKYSENIEATKDSYGKQIENLDTISATTDDYILQSTLSNSLSLRAVEQAAEQVSSIQLEQRGFFGKVWDAAKGAWNGTGGRVIGLLADGINAVGNWLTGVSHDASDFEGGWKPANSVTSFVTGLAGGVVNLAGGLANMAAHPFDTAEGLAGLLGFNIGAPGSLWSVDRLGHSWKELGKALISYEEFEKGHYATGVGQIGANILAAFLTSGGSEAGAAAKGAAAAGKVAAGAGIKATATVAATTARAAVRAAVEAAGGEAGFFTGRLAAAGAYVESLATGTGRALLKAPGALWEGAKSLPGKIVEGVKGLPAKIANGADRIRGNVADFVASFKPAERLGGAAKLMGELEEKGAAGVTEELLGQTGNAVQAADDALRVFKKGAERKGAEAEELGRLADEAAGKADKSWIFKNRRKKLAEGFKKAAEDAKAGAQKFNDAVKAAEQAAQQAKNAQNAIQEAGKAQATAAETADEAGNMDYGKAVESVNKTQAADQVLQNAKAAAEAAQKLAEGLPESSAARNVAGKIAEIIPGVKNISMRWNAARGFVEKTRVVARGAVSVPANILFLPVRMTGALLKIPARMILDGVGGLSKVVRKIPQLGREAKAAGLGKDVYGAIKVFEDEAGNLDELQRTFVDRVTGNQEIMKKIVHDLKANKNFEKTFNGKTVDEILQTIQADPTLESLGAIAPELQNLVLRESIGHLVKVDAGNAARLSRYYDATQTITKAMENPDIADAINAYWEKQAPAMADAPAAAPGTASALATTADLAARTIEFETKLADARKTFQEAKKNATSNADEFAARTVLEDAEKALDEARLQYVQQHAEENAAVHPELEAAESKISQSYAKYQQLKDEMKPLQEEMVKLNDEADVIKQIEEFKKKTGLSDEELVALQKTPGKMLQEKWDKEVGKYETEALKHYNDQFGRKLKNLQDAQREFNIAYAEYEVLENKIAPKAAAVASATVPTANEAPLAAPQAGSAVAGAPSVTPEAVQHMETIGAGENRVYLYDYKGKKIVLNHGDIVTRASEIFEKSGAAAQENWENAVKNLVEERYKNPKAEIQHLKIDGENHHYHFENQEIVLNENEIRAKAGEISKGAADKANWDAAVDALVREKAAGAGNVVPATAAGTAPATAPGEPAGSVPAAAGVPTASPAAPAAAPAAAGEPEATVLEATAEAATTPAAARNIPRALVQAVGEWGRNQVSKAKNLLSKLLPGEKGVPAGIARQLETMFAENLPIALVVLGKEGAMLPKNPTLAQRIQQMEKTYQHMESMARLPKGVRLPQALVQDVQKRARVIAEDMARQQTAPVQIPGGPNVPGGPGGVPGGQNVPGGPDGVPASMPGGEVPGGGTPGTPGVPGERTGEVRSTSWESPQSQKGHAPEEIKVGTAIERGLKEGMERAKQAKSLEDAQMILYQAVGLKMNEAGVTVENGVFVVDGKPTSGTFGAANGEVAVFAHANPQRPESDKLEDRAKDYEGYYNGGLTFSGLDQWFEAR